MMHEREKSDLIVVAEKPAKPVAPAAGEPVEQRVRTKGKVGQDGTHRTPSRASVASGLACLRRAVSFLAVIHPRWEPGALIGHAGFCAGGAWQHASLPRPLR
jgi:hypothetical protein